MSKLPYIPWYIGDWRKDPGVQALTFHDRGIWFEILCLMYESQDRGKLLLNGQPMPDDALARLLGLDKQVLSASLTKILDYGVASRCESTGALMNRRMVKDEELRKVRQESGRLGGNPVLVKYKVNQKSNQNSEDEIEIESENSAKGSPREFEQFWEAYPKKKAKGSAVKAWKSGKLDEKLPMILTALAWQKKSPDWLKDSGQFIPFPATYLRAARWLDESANNQMQKFNPIPPIQ